MQQLYLRVRTHDKSLSRLALSEVPIHKLILEQLATHLMTPEFTRVESSLSKR